MAVRRGRGRRRRRRPWQREWRRRRAWPLALCSVLCCVRRQQICCPPRSVNSNRLTSGQTSEAAEVEDGRGRCYLCNHGPRTHARGEPASELLYSTRDRIQCDELVFGSDCLIDQRARHHRRRNSPVSYQPQCIGIQLYVSWRHYPGPQYHTQPGCQCHESASFSALM